ncbi:MAG TPA: extracellular solute-binding protein [Roseiflexaceae bacterium]|nr:extracellular solute-binding protein [Roseiflexaceae bacterium]
MSCVALTPQPGWRGALALLLALLLGACNPAPSDVPAVQDSAPSPDGAEPTVITFGDDGARRELYAPLIERFNTENPDIRVQFVDLADVLRPDSAGNYDLEQIARGIASRADTFYAQGGGGGAFRDLRPLIEADPAFELSDLLPQALPAAGPIDRLPISVAVQVLAYNQELFRAQGLPEPSAGWGWTDMRAAAEQLARRGPSEIDIYGLIDAGRARIALAGELAAAGVSKQPSSLRDALSALTADDPRAADVARALTGLIQSGAVYVDLRPVQQNDQAELVRAGRAGMWLEGLLEDDGQGDPGFAVGRVALPELPLAAAQPDVYGYGMSSGTLHPEAAWRWLAFLSRQTPPAADGAPASVRRLPIRRSVLEQSGVLGRLPQDAAAAVQDTLRQPAYPYALPPAAWIGDAVFAGLGGEDLAQALAQSYAGVERALSQPSAPTAAAPAIVVATPAPALAAGPDATAITFAAAGLDVAAVQRLAEAFRESNPEIAVTVVPGQSGDARLGFADSAAGADCFAKDRTPAPDEATALLDLQPLLDADAAFPRDDFPPLLLALLRQEGRLLGLPQSVELPLVAYRPALLRAAGVPEPRPDWTADDLLAAARQLAGAGAPDQYGFASRLLATDATLLMLRALGEPPVRREGDTLVPRFTDPAVLAALGSYVELLRSSSPYTRLPGYAQNTPGVDGAALVAQGRAGLWLDGTEALRGGADAPSVVPLPAADEAARPLRVGGLYIAARSQYPQECWRWLSFLSGQPSAAGRGFPARRSLATAPSFLGSAAPGAAGVYRAYAATLDRAAAQPGDGEWFAREELDYYWLYRAIDRALQGADLERELRDAQALTERYLSCVGGDADAGACARRTDPEYTGLAQ